MYWWDWPSPIRIWQRYRGVRWPNLKNYVQYTQLASKTSLDWQLHHPTWHPQKDSKRATLTARKCLLLEFNIQKRKLPTIKQPVPVAHHEDLGLREVSLHHSQLFDNHSSRASSCRCLHMEVESNFRWPAAGTDGSCRNSSNKTGNLAHLLFVPSTPGTRCPNYVTRLFPVFWWMNSRAQSPWGRKSSDGKGSAGPAGAGATASCSRLALKLLRSEKSETLGKNCRYFHSFIPSFLLSFLPSVLRSFRLSFSPSLLLSFSPSLLLSFSPSLLLSFSPSFLPSFFLSFVSSANCIRTHQHSRIIT